MQKPSTDSKFAASAYKSETEPDTSLTNTCFTFLSIAQNHPTSKPVVASQLQRHVAPSYLPSCHPGLHCLPKRDQAACGSQFPAGHLPMSRRSPLPCPWSRRSIPRNPGTFGRRSVQRASELRLRKHLVCRDLRCRVQLGQGRRGQRDAANYSLRHAVP